jgi:trk system potassium uptake protein TrkH
MVVWVTALLLLGGMVMFLLLEWNNPATLAPLSVPGKALAALFQSTTLRTCGYISIDQGGMTEASQFFSCVLMVVGGSPASTAGGMKTTSLGVILFSLLSVMRGRTRVEAFGRSLRLEILQKALAVATLVLFLVFASTLILVFSERVDGYIPTFLELLFETSSAVGTVGLTAGLTPHLSTIGKIVLILCMYIGRVGPITLVIALSLRMKKGGDGIAFPEEQVIVG